MIGFMPSPREHILWESGGMTASAEIDFFQKLIDGEALDTLPARYESRAKELIAAGVIYT